MKTKHREGCERVFRRYDALCPRCCELMAGAKPRAGWNDHKKLTEAREIEYMKSHFAPGGPHSRGECGPVCTAFDW